MFQNIKDNSNYNRFRFLFAFISYDFSITAYFLDLLLTLIVDWVIVFPGMQHYKINSPWLLFDYGYSDCHFPVVAALDGGAVL